jgi:hypothetical protein
MAPFGCGQAAFQQPLAKKGFWSHRPFRRDDPVTQSGAALETQGTAMTLNHSVDPPPHPRPGHDGPHPALSLILGFGLIVVGATLIHIVFNVLV